MLRTSKFLALVGGVGLATADDKPKVAAVEPADWAKEAIRLEKEAPENWDETWGWPKQMVQTVRLESQLQWSQQGASDHVAREKGRKHDGKTMLGGDGVTDPGREPSPAEHWDYEFDVSYQHTQGCDLQCNKLILHMLRTQYSNKEKDGAILDVGACVGRYSQEIISLFGHQNRRNYEKSYSVGCGDPTQGERCTAPDEPNLNLFAFEPSPNNLKRLKEVAEKNNWHFEGFQSTNLAIANHTGKHTLYVNMQGLRVPTGSVDPMSSFGWRNMTYRTGLDVRAVTLDTFIEKKVMDQRVFFAHISTNGQDVHAILGARKAFKQKKIRFVVWYNTPAWSEVNENVLGLADLMHMWGYACFAMTPAPVPINGPFKPETYWSHGVQWSPVLCGHKFDMGLYELLRLHSPTAIRWFGHGDWYNVEHGKSKRKTEL